MKKIPHNVVQKANLSKAVWNQALVGSDYQICHRADKVGSIQKSSYAK